MGERGEVRFITGRTGGSVKIQVGNVKYNYIKKNERIEWAPFVTGVHGEGGG